MVNPANASAEDSTWKGLCRLGGVAAGITAVLILSEVIFFAFYPQPSTVLEWFQLFHSNPIIGLLDFWGLEVPMYVLFVMVFLALCVVLRRTGEGRVVIATALAVLGIGVFLATNNPVSMLSLSNQYAAATTDGQRSMLLTAGQTILANTGQRAVGGFNAGLFLVSLAGLLISWIMFQSSSFGRRTAYAGVLANALSLADYVREALAPPVVVTLVVVLANAVFLATWFALVSRTLLRLGNLRHSRLANAP